MTYFYKKDGEIFVPERINPDLAKLAQAIVKTCKLSLKLQMKTTSLNNAVKAGKKEQMLEIMQKCFDKYRKIYNQDMSLTGVTVEEVDGVPDFYEYRRPGNNPKMKWKHKMSILWRPELAHIQELNGMPKYKERSKDFVVDKILLKVPEDVLRVQMCNELFERDYTTIGETISNYKSKRRGQYAKGD